SAACAQDPPPQVSTQQRGGTYVEPPAQVDPVYTPQPIRTEPAAREGHGLSLVLALELPLRSGGSASAGRGTQGSTAVSPTLQARLRWMPVADAFWFAQVVFHRYLRGDRQQPWHPDFSYAFGWDDWRPHTWSFFYANYTGTRFSPDANEGRFNFPQGQYTLRYNYLLPAALAPLLLVGDGDAAACNAALNLRPRYVDARDGSLRPVRTSLSTGCRYARPEGWYAQFALFAYPEGDKQQPWDPDYTYGFGWEDPSPHGGLSLGYNNYSGNRFPGRARGPGEGTFRSGSITLAWKLAW
ncbi:MAG TPA: hypothetical protein VHL79_13845, partial [Ramlibacter sp.]|nr:hypothetical protein [Ramlibacter sp.]